MFLPPKPRLAFAEHDGRPCDVPGCTGLYGVLSGEFWHGPEGDLFLCSRHRLDEL